MIPADEAVTGAFAAVVGGATAHLLVRFRLISAPKSLYRTNVNGRAVPAVLGGPLVMSGLLALLSVAVLGALGWDAAGSYRMAGATSLLLGSIGAAGSWDDRLGDERPRGFRGHFRALRSRSLTGGLVKAIVGGVAGLLAGLILGGDLLAVLEVGVIVALSANLLNLFDRAPGRAGKVAFLVAAPLFAFGDASFTVTTGGAFGALAVCLVFDLSETAMLGDAGANPVGALVGLGLAASLSPGARLVASAVLLVLNLASEKWSFSRVIEATPWLRFVDELGRRK